MKKPVVNKEYSYNSGKYIILEAKTYRFTRKKSNFLMQKPVLFRQESTYFL